MHMFMNTEAFRYAHTNKKRTQKDMNRSVSQTMPAGHIDRRWLGTVTINPTRVGSLL
jgi:hypothetical protein